MKARRWGTSSRFNWSDARGAALCRTSLPVQKPGRRKATAEIIRIRSRIDPATYQRLAADHFSLNDIGEAEMVLSHPIPFDPYHKNRETGGFILTDRISNKTVACGMIMHALRRAGNVQWQFGELERGERAAIKGQKPCVVWLTGLSGSASQPSPTVSNADFTRWDGTPCCWMATTFAMDSTRTWLHRSGPHREHPPHSEVAKLMADAGLIVITAFISPFRAERDMVRRLPPHGEFVETRQYPRHERRDPKGSIAGRSGEIPNFTGINPYEIPEHPEILLIPQSHPPRERR
jgi:bifunctional enzyme CysN/CysC